MLAAERGACDDTAGQVFDRIVENWRWSHYWWSGKTGIDDVYAAGKKISALIFWTKNTAQPVRGLCTAELSLCVAYEGVYLDPTGRRMQIASGVAVKDAFTAFVNSGLRDASHMNTVEGLRPSDFDIAEQSVTLPVLEPPCSISSRIVPQEASSEAERIAKRFRCVSPDETTPRACTGTLVFAYYGNADPYWFIARTCSTACEFKGDAIGELARGDRGWEARSSGYIASPKAEVVRLKQQIEKAEMFRFQIK
jgi:hypothetical protein